MKTASKVAHVNLENRFHFNSKSTPKIYLISILAMFCYSTATRAVAAPGDFLDQGTTYYRRGDFLSASAALNWALRQSPTDGNAHYYLANVLVKLGRMGEAQIEYQRAFLFSHDPKIKSYCQTALNQFMQANSSPGVSALVPATVSPGKVSISLPTTVAGATAVGMITSPVTASPAVTQATAGVSATPGQLASQRIDEQANLTSLGMLKDGDSEVAQWQREGVRRAEAARVNADRNAQDMRMSVSKKVEWYTPEQIEAMRQQTVASGQEDQRQAEENGARALQYARAKVWETQAAAVNLQAQLNKPSLPGSAKLKAEGTSLYVRTFDTPLIDPGAGQRAHAWKLNPTLPLIATPKSLDLSQRTKGGGTAGGEEKRKGSVFGQVLQ